MRHDRHRAVRVNSSLVSRPMPHSYHSRSLRNLFRLPLRDGGRLSAARLTLEEWID